MSKLTEAKHKALQRVFDIVRREERYDVIERELLLEKDCFMKEDLNKFYSKTRTAYRSGKRYTFKEWINQVMDIMDELN